MKTTLRKKNPSIVKKSPSSSPFQSNAILQHGKKYCCRSPLLVLGSIATASILIFLTMAFLVRDRGYLFNASDPFYYYVYTRSMFHDHDLDFSNEFRYFNETNRDPAHAFSLESKPKNKYPAGTALLIAPFYVAVNVILGPWFFDGRSTDDFPWLLDQIVFSIGGIIVGSIGLWLSYLFVSWHFPKKNSLIATVAFWACSPLIYYFIREPFMSHLCALFCTSLFLTVWKSPALNLNLRALFMCTAIALSFMTRPQDIVIVLVPVTFFILTGFNTGKNSIKKLSYSVLFCVLGFSAVFLIQMVIWRSLYGTALINTYFHNGEKFLYYKNPYLFSVLFSSNHGLISWHPVVALCLVGLFFTPRPLRSLAWAFLVWFSAQLYVTASWWGWSMGTSFGNRAFLSLSPAFIFGLASIYGRISHSWGKILFFSVLAILFFWNLTLMFAFLSEMIPYSGSFSWWELIKHIPDLHMKIAQKIASM